MPIKPSSPLILAIDPGFDRVGWAVGYKQANQVIATAHGLLQTDRSLPLFQRYFQIQNELQQLIEKHSPKILAIEKLFFARNKTTALKVSEARGVIIITALNAQMEITEYTPNEIKLAVAGDGQADKIALEKMVRIQLRLENTKIIDDTIDALAILITACFH